MYIIIAKCIKLIKKKIRQSRVHKIKIAIISFGEIPSSGYI